MADEHSQDPDPQTGSGEVAQEGVSYRIRREAGGALTRFLAVWREKRWLRWLSYLFGVFLLAWIVGWALLARDLPDAKTLLQYEPPLPTMVRDIDGEIVHSYARDRRVQLQFDDIPRPLINAYLAAEDKTFWSHGGIDLGGVVGAVIDYARKYGSGERAVGGSTITQQVAKNILLTNEYSVSRKLREMLLARRIESVLTKEQILELYLNEIPLGRRSFGVQAASLAYFDKDVNELELHEMAFLAILPRAPEVYGRSKNQEVALTRRNWVLDQMVSNDFVTAQQAEAAKAKPLGLVTGRSQRNASAEAGYFLEAMRRELIRRYGENAEDGPHSVYAGGLWVRSSLDRELQSAARSSLRAGMLRYHGNRGWTGPIATLKMEDGNWAGQLASTFMSLNYRDWRIGVVTQRQGNTASVGFSDGSEAPLVKLPNTLKAGDIIAVAPQGSSWAVQTIPSVSGGFLAEQPGSGRVLAMQGGFDSGVDSFNRATQANRQPGSTIKPFVYATGLDQGMTPASMVLDGQYCYYQGSRLGEKCFRNFGGSRGSGEHTMRWGLEQSRNLMTVHIAMDSGMDNVIKTFERVGIGSYQPYPAFALGAGETTVQKMVNAYAALVNHGRQPDSTLFDYVQDRRGKVIWRADDRACPRCSMAEWDGKPMPRLDPRGKQVLDPGTSFQVVHMLTGVVQRGTATVLRDLNIPLFGKTGTTSGPTNVWFVGGSPDIVAGVYLGFDVPKNMGGYAQGGTLAAPIFKQFVRESRDRWSGRPFTAPNGIRMIRIDRRSGRRVYDGWPSGEPKAATIWEAFKPDTEPSRATDRENELEEMRRLILAQIRRGSETSQVIRAGAEAEQEAETEEDAQAAAAAAAATETAASAPATAAASLRTVGG